MQDDHVYLNGMKTCLIFILMALSFLPLGAVVTCAVCVNGTGPIVLDQPVCTTQVGGGEKGVGEEKGGREEKGGGLEKGGRGEKGGGLEKGGGGEKGGGAIQNNATCQKCNVHNDGNVWQVQQTSI